MPRFKNTDGDVIETTVPVEMVRLRTSGYALVNEKSDEKPDEKPPKGDTPKTSRARGSRS